MREKEGEGGSERERIELNFYFEDDGFRPWPKSSSRSSLVYIIHKYAHKK